jgi:very-short-patch-repair endonuclease
MRLSTARDTHLQQQGYAVLRFWNTEILRDEESVLVRIFDALHAAPSTDGANPIKEPLK